MNTPNSQALTAADIEAILAENVKSTLDSNQSLPEFLWDYIDGDEFGESPEWAAAAFGKKGQKNKASKRQGLRTAKLGSWRHPALTDASPYDSTTCDFVQITNRGNSKLSQSPPLRLGGYDGGCVTKTEAIMNRDIEQR